jgi:phospholipid/cholesterol/gamma-HCH transport system ATP-binding protein
MPEMTAQQEPVIELRDLHYEVAGRVILNGISLTIYAGEIFAVMGLSGMGKTTILRLIMGLIHPTRGSILVLGQDITRMDERDLNRLRAQLGLVFQFGALFDSLTVRENVGFRLYEQSRLREGQIRAQVAEKLALVGMSGTEDLYPSELSGGMQKRAGIARALISDPHVLLYDEPTSGLDPVIKATIDEVITRLRAEVGVAEVIVSHDVLSILRMADRVAMLHDGRLQFVGTIDEVKTCTDPVVRQFLEGRIEGPIHVV